MDAGSEDGERSRGRERGGLYGLQEAEERTLFGASGEKRARTSPRSAPGELHVPRPIHRTVRR